MFKFKNIEIFRFIFALIVCYHHMIINWGRGLYPDIDTITKYYSISLGEVCVDLFFIIAGYFLFFSLEKSQSILDFAIKRIKRIFPVLFVSIFLVCLLNKTILTKWIQLFLDSIFLQSTAFTPEKSISVAAWFVSSLFLVSIFYTAIVKILKKREALFLISICTFLAYSYCIPNGGNVEEMVNFCLTYGTIRGFAGIGLGYLLAEFLIRKKKEITNFLGSSIIKQIFTTIIEISTTVCILWYTIFGATYKEHKIICIILFIVLFSCLILKQGWFSKLLDNNISVFLGKYAFSIYLMQTVYNTYARKNFWKDEAFISEHFALAVFLNLIGYTLLGIVTYHLVENPPSLIKKIIKKDIKCINQ